MDVNLNLLDNKPEIKWRSGLQPILPVKTNETKHEGYDIYPYHSVGEDKIFNGYSSLATWIVQQKFVAIDGYVGLFWQDIQKGLEDEFEKQGLSVRWIKMADYLKSVSEVQEMVSPFIGQPGTVWGTRCTLNIKDFYRAFEPVKADHTYEVNIVIGMGAALMADAAALIYIDLPKNELQLRMRAGSITNFGNDAPESPSEMYKRFYFVDWVVCNEHKQAILNRINLIADAQWKDAINWMLAGDFKEALKDISQSVLRVRPWFEPGAWGGQWMKERIKGLNKDDVNLAWSFELIVPENGIIFESEGYLLEVSFDFLMFQENTAVLGKHAEQFGFEFPIRFDFLDTWDGGNLSIQCHPSLKYIRENFGENITQDETYYILDCQENANVYLGFQDDINPGEFRKELEDSQENGVEVEITKYVQSFTAKKHDLFLIPNGTVHSAGAGNLVLEISATPYIFTFKMYDWLRLDLNGEPRAINIEHAFNNLKFDRKGDKVTEELISKQQVIKSGVDWQLVHVPTHRDHFYDVHRLEFDSAITVDTEGGCHVLMLVEGSSISVKTKNGLESIFYYAETFVIPAAAESYTLYNTDGGRAKVVKAFLKDYQG